ncbi:hypothetical protein [Alloscardovia macacae]|uniref:hypothetical protein n=1 Tax=Alloscardovia macacae TaxID=1160091 RepID=UPI0011787853|nr:hypothetical protein [Alloscardovia macacae]
MTNSNVINETIRGELAAQSKDQAALAIALGFTDRRQVSYRLSGERHWKLEELLKTAEFLGFTHVSQLFALAEEREKRIERS